MTLPSMPDSLANRPRVLRIGALLDALPGCPLPVLAADLRRYRDALVAGGAVDARVGIRANLPGITAAAAAQGSRHIEAADAVLQVDVAHASSSVQLIERLQGAASFLHATVNAERSGCVAGTAHLIRSGDGKLMMGMLGRRHPSVDAAGFSRWWLHQHGPLALRVLGERAWAYEQLHGDDALSRAANVAAGFGDVRFHIYESIRVDSLADFFSAFTPRVTELVQQDESGYLDHSLARITWTELLP